MIIASQACYIGNFSILIYHSKICYEYNIKKFDIILFKKFRNSFQSIIILQRPR